MTDLSFDHDNRQIELEIAIADAISRRQIWCAVYLAGYWNLWQTDDEVIGFMESVPRLPPEFMGHGIN